MNRFSVTGYKDNSPDRNQKQNLIQGRNITMKGVSIPLTLIPIVGGKPAYDRKRIAKPGDPDIEFEEDVEGVLELPNNQMGNSNPYVTNFLQNQQSPQYQGLSGLPPAMSQKPPSMEEYQKQFAGTEGLPTDPNASLYNKSLYNTTGIDGGGQEYASQGYGDSNLDSNQAQQAQASIVKSKQQSNQASRIGSVNPYGGWNMQNASTALGAFIQDKNALGTIGSAGKILLEGTRNALAGAANMKVYNESKAEYEDDLEENERRQGWRWMQKGGKIGQILTGNYIEGDDEHPDPNVEVERGEYTQTPDGKTMEVLGDRHSTGGELLDLPEGSKVISDYLKIGVKLATLFKKEYGLNVRAGSTFATILDQYKKKIGLTELLEDEARIMGKIADQEEVEFESTREINLQVLSEKVNELKPQKQELEDRFEMFTNMVYEKQEETKSEEEENFDKQEGGEVDETVMDENGQPVPEQEVQPVENNDAQIEQMIQVYSQMTGQNPEEIIQQLQQLGQEELQQAIEQISQAVQQGMSQGEAEVDESTQSFMQMGGGIEESQQQGGEDQMMQQIAQALQQGTPPEQIMQQLVQEGIPEEQAQQLLQQIMQSMGGEVQQQEAQPEVEPIMKKGGRLNSMKFLDKAQEESVMYAQTAGEVPPRKTYTPYKIPSGRSRVGEVEVENEFVDPLSERSVNGFFDTFADYSEAGKVKAEAWKIKYDAAKTNDQKIKIMDQAQGDRQNFIQTMIPEKVLNISASGYAPVQTDIQMMYDGLKTKKEKDEYAEVLKQNGWGINDKGVVLGGNYKYQPQYKPGNSLFEYTKKYGEANPDTMSKIYKQRRTDGRWDRRYEKLHEMEFPSEKERDLYAKENGMIIEGDYWIDPKDSNNIIINKINTNLEPGEKPVKKKVDATGDLEAMGNLDKNWETGLPMLTPDQSNLPPNYLPIGYREVGSTQANKIKISPEETLRELNRQYSTASDAIIGNNPYTAGAAQANLQAQTNNSINQAYSQAAVVNAQDERNVDNTNEQRIMQRDQTNTGRMDQYEKLAITGLDNYNQSWRNYIDKRNLEGVNNYNLENQRQAFNAVNDNYKIGSNGWYQTDETPIFYYTGQNGQPMAFNRQTEETYEVTNPNNQGGKTKTKTKTTTGTKPKHKQKGGILLSKNTNWLK